MSPVKALRSAACPACARKPNSCTMCTLHSSLQAMRAELSSFNGHRFVSASRPIYFGRADELQDHAPCVQQCKAVIAALKILLRTWASVAPFNALSRIPLEACENAKTIPVHVQAIKHDPKKACNMYICNI